MTKRTNKMNELKKEVINKENIDIVFITKDMKEWLEREEIKEKYKKGNI